MTVRLRWTPTALQRLDEIEEYIEKDNPTAASSLILQLIELAETLTETPNRGRHVPELWAENLREVIHGNYRLIYRIRSNVIEVLTVFEGHRLFRPGEIE